jgi:hypothetical protein
MIGNKRTGLPTIKATAKAICALVTTYTPVVKKLFPDNTELHDALAAINVACAAIVPIIDEVLDPGV